MDESIARHADTETLYDEPYEDRKKVRVTGPFTVFAPTNEAFAKLDPCVLNTLLSSDTETLTQILLYHVA